MKAKRIADSVRVATPRKPLIGATGQAQSYIGEFDSLRALAVFGVMASHFAGGLSHLVARMGHAGVVLFFTLSGFLITGILLDCVRLASDQTVTRTLTRFYIRRALRIFPLYYLAVCAFLLLNPEIRSNCIWFFVYAVNIGKVIEPHNWAPLSHFWTLAVEEQFYIFWPLVVLAIAPRRLPCLCLCMVVVAFVARFALFTFGASNVAIQQLTPCCLDSLALGAYVIAARREDPVRADSVAKKVVIVSGVLSALLYFLASDKLLLLVAPTAYGVFFAGALCVIASCTGSSQTKMLRVAPVAFLGKISYGLYVWHLPVHWLYAKFLSEVVGWNVHEYFAFPFDSISHVAVLVVATIALAALSWFCMERPVNSLKRHFPYRVRPTLARDNSTSGIFR